MICVYLPDGGTDSYDLSKGWEYEIRSNLLRITHTKYGQYTYVNIPYAISP